MESDNLDLILHLTEWKSFLIKSGWSPKIGNQFVVNISLTIEIHFEWKIIQTKSWSELRLEFINSE